MALHLEMIMMKRPLSLKLFISISFLIFAVIIVVTYSFISAHFFFRGMDNIIASNLERAGYSYLHSRAYKHRETIKNFHRNYTVTYDWKELSADIRQEFSQPISNINEVYKINKSSWFERPDVIYFVMRVQIDDEQFFISQTLTAKRASAIVGRNIKQSMKTLFVISISMLITMALFIWLLLRRIALPVSQLNQWTHQLDSKSLSQTAPNFAYPELNEMAKLIQNSLSSVQQSLEREERFLAYASHELRTPISVIRNNIELLNKLRQNAVSQDDSKFAQIIDRIDRASLTMKHLSETLLWLSREDSETLPSQHVDIAQQINQLSDEMQYLLANKNIELSISTHAHVMDLAEIPARIILANLIRNAFQHTNQGEITIQQTGNTVIITNTETHAESEAATQDLGFGLGIQLTEQLAEKLAWDYQKSHDKNTYQVTITF